MESANKKNKRGRPKKITNSNSSENDIFAMRLCQTMTMRNETQASLANKITELYGGLQRQTISLYMTGKSKPDADRLTAICKALNVSADYLLGLIDVESYNTDIKSVCNITGLNDLAVHHIRYINKYAYLLHKSLGISLIDEVNDLLTDTKLEDLLIFLGEMKNSLKDIQNAIKIIANLDYESLPIDDMENTIKNFLTLSNQCEFRMFKAAQAFDSLIKHLYSFEQILNDAESLIADLNILKFQLGVKDMTEDLASNTLSRIRSYAATNYELEYERDMDMYHSWWYESENDE